MIDFCLWNIYAWLPKYVCMLSQYTIPLCIKPFNVRKGKQISLTRRACLLAKYVFTAFVALSQEKSIDFTKTGMLNQ